MRAREGYLEAKKDLKAMNDYLKVKSFGLEARDDYLRAKGDLKAMKTDLAVKKMKLHDVMERIEFYPEDRRPNDAKKVLKLATSKKGETKDEEKWLKQIRREILPQSCLAEPPMRG
ncbi:MAG: hypothetical protein NT051_00475 [Candidatus Micrarchaeota archaeon]|nr:hypothetical protein [Candidatus Micrarchaeota archaeon]